MSEILTFGHGGGELSPDKEQASCLEIVLIFQSETYWDVSEIIFDNQLNLVLFLPGGQLTPRECSRLDHSVLLSQS